MQSKIISRFSKQLSDGVKPKRRMQYYFEKAMSQSIHPYRIMANGYDRYIMKDHLIVLASGDSSLQRGMIDPQAFPEEMTNIMQQLYNKHKEEYIINPVKLAYDACIQTRVAGSASITLCTLHPRTGALSTFYVGDSVYGIFKKDGAEVVPEMEIAVNYAKMVGTRYDLKGGQSQCYLIDQIAPDDLLLVASDGLWDNIDVEKIHYYLKGPTSYTIKKTNKVISDSYHEEKEEKVYKTLLELARGLVKTAERCAHLKDYESPIYLKALKAKQNAVKAGIMDDVTVILARIAQREREDDKD